jgi:hypothetical protein
MEGVSYMFNINAPTLIVVALIILLTILAKRKEWFPKGPDDNEKNRLFMEKHNQKIRERVSVYYKGPHL